MAERKRIAVPILGIDTSTPDHSVTDGKCATLNNLRYTGNAWRNVKEFDSFDYSRLFDWEQFYTPVAVVIYKHLDYYIVYTIDQGHGPYMNEHKLYATKFNKESQNFGTPILIATKEFPYSEDNNGQSHRITNIFHFGKILHIMWDDDKEPQWYLLTEGKYVLYQIDDIYFEIDETIQTNPPLEEEIDSPKSILIPGEPSIDGDQSGQFYDHVVRAADLSSYQTMLRTFDDDEAWRGSICYFLAARAEDGTILAQSPLRILSSSSELFHSFKYKYTNINGVQQTDFFSGQRVASALTTYKLGSRLYAGIMVNSSFSPYNELSDYNKVKYRHEGTSPSTMYIKPKVSFNIIDAIEEFSSNIFDVALYCTRIHPIFTIASMARALPGYAVIEDLYNRPISPSAAYADEDLPNEPFFLAATKTIAELTIIGRGRKGEFLLDRATLENIESKGVVYEPQNSEHDISSSGRKEINNSLHLFGDIFTRFRKAYDNEKEMARFEKPANYTPDNQDEWLDTPALKNVSVLIKAEDNLYNSPVTQLKLNNGLHPFFFQCGRILSYPDYRAFEMIFGEEATSTADNTFKAALYKFKSATAINYAYYIPPYGGTETAPGAGLKYPTIRPYIDADYNVYDFGAYRNTLVSKGKVWASNNNNPTAFAFDRNYSIGTTNNEIIAINSAAIEMSDSKFGEFPLYVFTTEGIYAMQSGTETLYSAVIPINHDVIINQNTLSVNGAVLYFTDKGLHALTNQGAKLLSEPIHTEENRIPDWMRTCQMVHLPEWNELLCVDLPNGKAYVFSLDNNVWSTRDIPDGYILNNDELLTSNTIYNLRNEKENLSSDISFTLTTRPIKLGSMELKRAETMIVRFECATEQTLHIKVEGSIDTQNWGELRNIQTTTNKDVVIRRTTCSVKYLRFTISGAATSDIRILAFELEYYNRMRHRMR